MRRTPRIALSVMALVLEGRLEEVAAQQVQPNPCFRWSGQMTIANSPPSSSSTSPTGNSSSTIWYYGGEARTSQDQSSNLWTNALVALDLTRDWATGSPAISLVEPDNSGTSGAPPAVALGALWSSKDGTTLYQYGGQFSDNPSVSPPIQAVWSYTISTGTWATVQTTGDTITRAAEGSAAVVPNQGSEGDNVGYYFSGHLDDHTVQGWSNQIPRLYLNSMITLDLGSHVIKNLSTYSSTGSTSNNSQPEISPVYRADGTLTYVPNLGTGGKGVLVAIGGATATQYVDNSVLDVYDIGAGGWTKQATLGDIVGSRINHCAVRASAKVNGVQTHQIFIYGGQMLNQSNRDSAVYVLTIPSYTWVFVGKDLPGQPAGRAGHQCELKGSQLVVVGGYLGDNVICDQPGIYVYDVSKSAWQNKFTANSVYMTPQIVANITKGRGTGYSSSGSGATTGGDGTNDPDTSASTSTSVNGSGSGSTANGGSINQGGGSSSSHIGAIVGGVIGGLVALLGLLALLVLLARRRKKEKQSKIEQVARTDSSGSSDLAAFPYEKNPMVSSGHGSSPYRQSQEHMPASDDVEEETRGMEVGAFGSSLIPKRTLRVTNPEGPYDD